MAKLSTGDFSGIRYIIEGNILDIKSEGDFDKRGIVSNKLSELGDADLQSVINETVGSPKATK